MRRGRLAKQNYTPKGMQVARDDVAWKIKKLRSVRGQVKQFSELSDRTRNGDGQFVGNETAGVDPVTMKQAYGGKLKPGGAVAALLGGGALLGTKSGRVAAAGMARGASRVVRSSVAGLDRSGGQSGGQSGRHVFRGQR